MNVADVKKTLASAYQIVQASNKIILDSDHSYIVNKTTGEKTLVNVVNGEFQFDLWVPAPTPNQPPVKVDQFGRFTALITPEDDETKTDDSTFTRQDVR